MRLNRLKVFLLDLSRKKVLFIVISLLMIGASFFLFYLFAVNKDVELHQREGRFNLDTSQEVGTSLLKYYKFHPTGLTNYIVKLNFAIEGLFIDVRFCNKYSWILDLAKPFRTGVYRTINNNQQVLVSKFDYNKEPIFNKLKEIRVKNCPDSPHYKADNILLIFQCDLIERTASVYLNNKFCEKICLNEEDLKYLVSVSNYPNTRIFVKKMQILDNQGKVFFEVNDSFNFLYKTVSRIFFFFGLATLTLLLFTEKGFLRRLLILIIIVFISEAYLRTTEKDNPYLNIHVMKADWDVEGTTNLFGNYNSTDSIEICNFWRKKYTIAKSKDSLRIICLGSSPVEANNLTSDDKSFTALLERKLNENGERKFQVINAGITGYAINDINEAVYFSDVLIKLDPDLVIIYSNWRNAAEADIDLYNRMKKLLQNHPSWITNQRMLRMALEFKYPVKEIVYLYNFLCESYLFMVAEYVKGKIISPKFLITKPGKPKMVNTEFSFDRILNLCKKRNIKILLMPQFDFINNSVNKSTLKIMQEIQKHYNNVFCFNIELGFLRNKEYILSGDETHMNEYAHKVMAEEIYHKLINDGLISGYSN